MKDLVYHENKVEYHYSLKRVYDLNNSPFWIKVFGTVYVFSSDYNRENFKKRFSQRQKEIANRLLPYAPNKKNITGLIELTCFNLYTEIEKRGFRIIRNGSEILCQDKLMLVVGVGLED